METISHGASRLAAADAQRSHETPAPEGAEEPRSVTGTDSRRSLPRAIPKVSLFRLYLLRATYLLIVVGLGSAIWPLLLDSTRRWSHMHGAALALLAGVTVLAALGIRHPLRMLPLLLFELVWKSVWLLAIALPLWRAGEIDATRMESVVEIGSGLVLFPLVIPWRYVWATIVETPGDRWK